MKKIKEMFDEMEEEKENEIDDGITISREDFISEHKNLIGILRSGNKKLQEAEAKKQEEELAEETGEGMGMEED